MKIFVVANILFLCAVNVLSAAEISNSSGGFGYVPIGDGRCQVLVDATTMKPVFETSKRAASKIVMIGSKADCPSDYSGFKVNRMASGSVSGFIYTGTQDNGRKVYIYRRMGSAFTFRYGPNPKK